MQGQKPRTNTRGDLDLGYNGVKGKSWRDMIVYQNWGSPFFSQSERLSTRRVVVMEPSS